MSERTPIVLLDGATRQPVEAVLIEDVSEADVRRTDTLWKPFLRQSLQDAYTRGLLPNDLPEHTHWIWDRKWQAASRYSQFLGIECAGEMQALMVVRTDKLCRLPTQRGLPLIYVDYLAAAPWNLTEIASPPRFSRCGLILIAAAIRLSSQRGYNGRIGLHSLPQAEGFYGNKCAMTDFGEDLDYEGLRYFEMASVQAQAFLDKER